MNKAGGKNIKSEEADIVCTFDSESDFKEFMFAVLSGTAVFSGALSEITAEKKQQLFDAIVSEYTKLKPLEDGKWVYEIPVINAYAEKA